jgi:hypothetical protein
VNLVNALMLSMCLAICSGNLIPSDNVKEILVTTNPPNAKGSTVRVTDRQLVPDLVGRINRSRREPLVFYANYRVRIRYRNRRDALILVNGSSLKMNGKTYTADEDIAASLSQLFEK